MKELALNKRSLWLACLLFALVVFESWLIHQALADHQQQLFLRLGRTVAGLLGRAHEQKDDLALETIIQSFAKGPAIISAAVIDDEGKIMAHNLPSELGKPLHYASIPGQVHSYPLRDGGGEWGRLVFSLSARTAVETQRRLAFLMFLGGIVTWGLMAWHLANLERRFHEIKAAEKNLSDLVAAQQQKLDQGAQREKRMAQQWSLQLQEAIGRLREAVVVLDGQQRVAALNPAACQRLGLRSQSEALQRSWHELPLLQACGAQLEASLTKPGQRVEQNFETAAVQIAMESWHGAAAGTWVTLG